ncbi:MAG: substrate-binding domain-containing protein [Dysgonamonadaceae bacterium]
MFGVRSIGSNDGIPVSRSGRLTGAMIGMILAALTATAPVAAQEEEGKSAFRVCADPNNLPFSNQERAGFENKIAELLAKDLGLRVEYTWFPQRMGFIRNTLRSWVPEERRYKCDVIIGVASGFELASTTDPYYRSTYALVYKRGRGLDQVNSAQALLTLPEEQKRALKIGVFAPSPAVDWLLKHGLIDQAVPYQIQTGDPEDYPGEIIQKDLRADQIDLAFVWGPIAGYFAKLDPAGNIVVVPLNSEPGVQFSYPISMGVRHGEGEWKKTLEQAIARNEAAIENILADYNVPIVDEKGQVVHAAGAPK